jgi:hypothetical protein
MQYNSAQVENIMSRQILKVSENAAATLIQACWKRYKTLVWFKMITQLRLAAAIKIQSNYRLIRFLKVGPKIRMQKRFIAATTVQKYIRGYLSQKHSFKQMSLTLMNKNN